MKTCVFLLGTKFHVWGKHGHYLLQFGVWACSDTLWRKKRKNCLYLFNHDCLLCFKKQVILVAFIYMQKKFGFPSTEPVRGNMKNANSLQNTEENKNSLKSQSQV